VKVVHNGKMFHLREGAFASKILCSELKTKHSGYKVLLSWTTFTWIVGEKKKEWGHQHIPDGGGILHMDKKLLFKNCEIQPKSSPYNQI